MHDACQALTMESYLLAENYGFWSVTKVANTTSELECLDRFVRKLEWHDIVCDCPPLCEESAYELTTSYGVWPTERELPLVQNRFRQEFNVNVSREYIKRNYAAVEIYYEDFNEETLYDEPSYDTSMFFSDLGGQFGLWLGASIFSFIEVVVVLLKLLFITIRHTLKRMNGTMK